MAEKFPIVTNARQLGYRRRDSSVGTDVVPVETILQTEVKVVEIKGVLPGIQNASGNTAATNDFLEAFKVSDFGLIPKVEIRFPPGRFYLTEELVVWPGQWLIANQTTLVTHPSFADDAMVKMTGLGSFGSAVCYRPGVVGMKFESALSGVAAIRNDPGTNNVLNGTFRDIVLDTCEGLIFDHCYFQNNKIINLFSQGPINRIVKFAGNWNLVDNLEKEGVSGTSTAPYVQIGVDASEDPAWTIYPSAKNWLRRILIEGAGHVNKIADIYILFNRAFVLDQQWHETSISRSPYYLYIKDTVIGELLGDNVYDQTAQKLKLENSPFIRWNGVTMPGFIQNIEGVLEIDDESTITFDPVYTTADLNTYPLAGSEKIRIKSAVDTYMDYLPLVGVSPHSEPIMTGPNLFLNPGFDKKDDFWTLQSTETPTYTYGASPVSLSKWLNLLFLTEENVRQFYQVFTITADMVGHPMSIAGYVNIIAGGVNANATPLTFSAGVDDNLLFGRVAQGRGLHLIQRTFIPTTTGPMLLGITFANVTELEFGSFALRVGRTAIPDMGVPYEQKFVIGRMIDGTFTNWQSDGPMLACRVLSTEGDRAPLYLQHQTGGGNSGLALEAFSNGYNYLRSLGDFPFTFQVNATEPMFIRDDLVNISVPLNTTSPLSIDGLNITTGGAAPTTGTHVKGDIHHNSNSDSGEPSFWKCTVSGTPGTWVGCAIIP